MRTKIAVILQIAAIVEKKDSKAPLGFGRRRPPRNSQKSDPSELSEIFLRPATDLFRFVLLFAILRDDFETKPGLGLRTNEFSWPSLL